MQRLEKLGSYKLYRMRKSDNLEQQRKKEEKLNFSREAKQTKRGFRVSPHTACDVDVTHHVANDSISVGSVVQCRMTQ